MDTFRLSRFTVIAWSALSACALPSCGGSTPEGHTANSESDTPMAESHGESSRRSMAASSEVGALDPEKVTGTFESAMSDLQRCVNEGAKRIEFLGGEIAFFLKIGGDGKIAHIHAERSTIGDRQTEQCMFQALKKRTWPRPEGGEVGLARKSFAFDMPNDVRPPTDWSEQDVVQVISEVAEKIADCKQGVEGGFTATVYVDTDGTALGASAAPSDESGEAAADCVSDVLKSAKYPSPGSWPAKVTFTL